MRNVICCIVSLVVGGVLGVHFFGGGIHLTTREVVITKTETIPPTYEERLKTIQRELDTRAQDEPRTDLPELPMPREQVNQQKNSLEPTKPPSGSKTDQELIQGSWKMVYHEENGNVLDAEKMEGMLYIFDEDKMRMVYLQETTPTVFMTGTFSLDAAKSPKQLNGKQGNDELLGIYQLDGDRLMFCAPAFADVTKRPTEFKAPKGSRLLLVKLERVKEPKNNTNNQNEEKALKPEGSKKPIGKIEVEWIGKLETGIVAIGGETTGVEIKTKDGVFELSLSKDLMKKAEKLNNMKVKVKGTLTFPKGVERKGRRVIVVTELQPDPSDAPKD